MPAVRATITGGVQGVGFRYSTRRVANQLGVTGWVRNRPDGSVEVWAQGDHASLADFQRFLETGPPGARVRSVETTEVDEDPSLTVFEITF
jgi:acylphosphatase